MSAPPTGIPEARWLSWPPKARPFILAQQQEVEQLRVQITPLAVHARLRLIPNLSDLNLSGVAWHIRGITALAIAFVVVGALIRLGGLG
ncbi:hypothetical protein [Vulcanococcus limneticus]|uniref:hypothetical protein n=1 Tax=Vulcanococcus limneticus TaxID=2170428 RepID=UPI00398C0E4E